MKQLLGVFFLLSLLAAPVRADAPLPDQTARDVTDRIVALIKTNRTAYAKDIDKLYAMVTEQLGPHFDFRKIAQQVLGPAWRSATEAQRARFTDEFRALLVRTYGTALLKYTDETIVYLPLKIVDSDRVTTVRSQVQRGGGAPPIAINYSFYRTDAGWKVYDMAIEGPSVVTTYQRVFAERLGRDKLDAVIDGLAQENANARAAAGAK